MAKTTRHTQSGQKVLGSKESCLEKAPMIPRPTQTETIRLPSGETRTVKIVATNDATWNKFLVQIEGITGVTLDRDEMFAHGLATIVMLRVEHENEWEPYCQQQGIKRRKEVKSPFQPIIKWMLNKMEEKTGKGDHSSQASAIAGCLDEYWEIHRPLGMPPTEIPAWLSKSGGYSKVYKDRRARLARLDDTDPTEPKPKRYDHYRAVPALEERDTPESLIAFGGQIVLSVDVDPQTKKMRVRSASKLKGVSYWQASPLERVIAALSGGKAVEPPVAVETSVESTSEPEDTAADGSSENSPAKLGPAPVDNSDEPNAANGESDHPEICATPASVDTNLAAVAAGK